MGCQICGYIIPSTYSLATGHVVTRIMYIVNFTIKPNYPIRFV